MINNFKNSPAFRPNPMTGLRVFDAALPIRAAKKGGDTSWGAQWKNPRLADDDAALFYMLNQAFGLIRSKPNLSDMEAKLAARYLDEVYSQSARLFQYMLLIVTRESRHLKNNHGYFANMPKHHSSSEYAVPEASLYLWQEFQAHISGAGSGGAVDRFLSKGTLTAGEIGDCLLADYLLMVEQCFYNGSYSGGYGGEPWGDITKLLRRFVQGQISAEIFCDQAYTLCHNNGPMFNKGMLYSGYSSSLLKLLDIQHAGDLYTAGAYFAKHPGSKHQTFKLGGLYDQTKVLMADIFKEVTKVIPAESLLPEGPKYATPGDLSDPEEQSTTPSALAEKIATVISSLDTGFVKTDQILDIGLDNAPILKPVREAV